MISSTQRRGAEVFASQLHGVLVERGVDSELVALTAGASPSSLEVPVLGRHRTDPRLLWRLRLLARRHAVVVAHGSITLLTCVGALAASRVPFVYRNIGDPTYWRPARAASVRVGWPLRRARTVVAVWPGAADALQRQYGLPEDRIRVIPTGVPIDQFPPVSPEDRAAARRRLGLPEGEPVIAYLGSLTPEKAVGDAVDAVLRRSDVRLLIAGEGPLRAEVEQRAAPLGDRVVLLGAVDEPAAVLSAADALILPSRTEGLPAVAIEAGLVGIPTVATDVGGVSSVVVDGETGRLVPPGDVPALADAIGDVLRQANQLGRAARERCLRLFDLELVADRWHEVIAELGA